MGRARANWRGNDHGLTRRVVRMSASAHETGTFRVKLHGPARRLADAAQIQDIHITTSRAGRLALAVAIAEEHR